MVEFRSKWKVKAIVVIIITSVLFPCVSASTYMVGKETGWNLISNLHDWAAANPFTAGDFLVFLYNQSANDVLEVQHLDYLNCNASHPIRTYNSGKTVVKLTQPGPMYFICSRGDHCKRGLRLHIQVKSQLSYDSINGITTPTTISPSSSPTTSPPSDATSAHPRYGAGEVGKSLHVGYVLVIIVLVMLVLCCPIVSF
ncbi:mavicyanin [Ziziphus jujuba]|uniref:Mavicyanin n=1 Tax=Ziziphus jujuba TaxID=326968 RepID=A0ABM4A1L2_ZIZJJ|nr:mavicyanin-like isoform X1 [Ziziphus jujuba]XP_060670615.1 mavicyanin [Ziziphus jujuba]